MAELHKVAKRFYNFEHISRGATMEQTAINDPPNRVTDLIELKKRGVEVTCQTFFEILMVDFTVTSLGRSGHY